MSVKKIDWVWKMDEIISMFLDRRRENFDIQVLSCIWWILGVPNLVYFGYTIFWHTALSRKDFAVITLIISLVASLIVLVLFIRRELKEAIGRKLDSDQYCRELIANLRKLERGEDTPLNFSQLRTWEIALNPELEGFYEQVQAKAKDPSVSPRYVAMALATLVKTESYLETYSFNKARVYGCEVFETRTARGIHNDDVKRIATEILANHKDKEVEILNILKKESSEIYKIICPEASKSGFFS